MLWSFSPTFAQFMDFSGSQCTMNTTHTMNITSLLNFESMEYKGAQTQAASINQFVANALRVFIEDFYQRVAPSFMVIISCRRPSPMNFYRNIMQLLYESVDTMILQLIHYNHTRPQRIGGPRLHNLLLVDSLQALLDIEIHTYTARQDGSEYYFIFLQQRDALLPAELQGVFEYCWHHQLLNCNVMTQNSGGNVVMYTYFPYAATHCDVVLGQQINRFIGPRWQQPHYFPSKLDNLHGCPLQVLLRDMMPFFSLNQSLPGLEDRLLRELSRRMNFAVEPVNNQNQSLPWREHQMLQMLEGKRAHLAIGYIRKRVEHADNMTAVFPHYSSRLVGCLPLNAYNLTSWELLLFPFQTLAWLAVLTTFICVSCLMICTRRRHMDRATVLIAVLSIAWGQPSLVSGWRPAHQLLYVNWLGFTLLIRAMFSALFYYMLRLHVHQRLPRNLLQLLEDSYVTVANRITVQDLVHVGSLQALVSSERAIVLPSEEERDVLQIIESREQRRIFGILSHQTLLYEAQRIHKPGGYFVLPQHVLEQQLAIYLQKHSHLVKRLDELIMSIQAVGLINYWAGQLGSERYFRSTIMYRDKRLRLPDLYAIYVIVGVLYGLATLIFLWELISARWRYVN